MRPVVLAAAIIAGVVTLLGLGLLPKSGRVQHTIAVTGAPKVTEQDAQQDALAQAQIEVEKYLRTLDPPVHWKPSLEYIRYELVKNKLTTYDVPITDEETRRIVSDLGHGDQLQRVELSFEITPKVRYDLLMEARQERSEQRMLDLVPVLAGIVLVLIAGAAYLHLDERTKGYYTAWLGLIAGGAVVVVLLGAAWWFFRL